MRRPTQSLLAALPFLALVFGSTYAFAATQCTCPRILASGEGNTSCSASESNNKCTVDFNVFLEREDRAVRLLAGAGISNLSIPDNRTNAVDALAQLRGRQSQFTDAILIYLIVALSAQPNTSDLTDVVRRVSASVRSGTVGDRIMQAFDPSGAGFGGTDEELRRRSLPNASIENFGNQITGRVVPGCIELFAGNTWVMFKAFWSPYRVMPRCGQ